MLPTLQLRVFGILSVAALAVLTPEPMFLALFSAAALGHYALSFIYSRRPAARVWNRRGTRLPLAVLGLLGVAIIAWDYPVASHPVILLYFGIHHVLSEVYLARAGVGKELRFPGLVASRFALNLLVFLFLVRYHSWAATIPPVLVAGGIALAAVAVAVQLYRLRGVADRGTLLDHALFEGLGLVMVLVSLFAHVSFIQIIFYHVAVWFLVPLGMLRAHGGVAEYLLRTAAVTGGLLLLTPLAGLPLGITMEQMLDQVYLWGYLHITASFALSSLNPAWVRNWFQPVVRARADTA